MVGLYIQCVGFLINDQCNVMVRLFFHFNSYWIACNRSRAMVKARCPRTVNMA
jgi:hypothetical protein